MKTTLEGINIRITEAEECISDLKDRKVKITEIKKKRRRTKKMRQSNDLWDNFRCTSIHVTFQKEKKGERPKNIFKGIIAVNFTNIEKETLTNVPAFRKHRGVPGRLNCRNRLGHTVIKLTKVKHKENY